MTASSIAPTAITASTTSELVPAPASTAGMVNTPVPMMLPTTRPVADVRPRARAFCCVRVDAGSWSGPLLGRLPMMLDIGSSPGCRLGAQYCDLLLSHWQDARAAAFPGRDIGPRSPARTARDWPGDEGLAQVPRQARMQDLWPYGQAPVPSELRVRLPGRWVMKLLNSLDASFIDAEDEDSQASFAIASVAVFEGPAPSYEEFLTAVTGRMPLVPLYRRKLRKVPFTPGPPVWVDDPDFDL